MNTRIKQLRKALKLTQQEFSDKIGIRQNTVAKYETGRGTPTRAVVSLICREFRVNEEWLRTGNGDMFLPGPRDELEEAMETLGLPLELRAMVEKYLKLSPREQEVVVAYVRDVAGTIAQMLPEEPQCSQIEKEADEFAAMAREQYLLEKMRESQASSPEPPRGYPSK